MEKKTYVSPEMEIVEITEQGGLLAGASRDGDMGGGDTDWNDKP